MKGLADDTLAVLDACAISNDSGSSRSGKRGLERLGRGPARLLEFRFFSLRSAFPLKSNKGVSVTTKSRSFGGLLVAVECAVLTAGLLRSTA